VWAECRDLRVRAGDTCTSVLQSVCSTAEPVFCVPGRQQYAGGGVRRPPERQRKDGLASARLGFGTEAGATIAHDTVITILNNLLFEGQPQIYCSVS
jgi:hypothetical protein